MKVYLLEEGDGGDGDESQPVNIYATRENAEAAAREGRLEDLTRGGYRTREEAEAFIAQYGDGYRWSVTEWEVLS